MADTPLTFAPSATYHLTAGSHGLHDRLARPDARQRAVRRRHRLSDGAGAAACGGRNRCGRRRHRSARRSCRRSTCRKTRTPRHSSPPRLLATRIPRRQLLLLPSGFTVEAAQADAVAISGSGDATNLDRGHLSDRFMAIARGQLDPATGEFAGGAGPGADGVGPGPGAALGAGQFGGRGGGLRRSGASSSAVAARAARIHIRERSTISSAARSSTRRRISFAPMSPVRQPQFAQNTFGATFGGPLKVPGLYQDTNRRTNFQLNFTGNQSNNVFDQYATVPTPAMRSGDFASSPIELFDPATGAPFAGNQVPMSAASQVLLNFIPMPNLPGMSNNFHTSSTVHSLPTP